MPLRRKAKQVAKLTEEENSDKGIERENEQEAERQIAAIKAIRDVKIGQSLTALRLLCSYYAEEQLQRPVLEFFKENFPGISFEEENGEIEVFQGTSGNRMLASYLRIPEVNGQRLSFGMTPKTRRQPKAGEMMLALCAWLSFGSYK